MTIIFVTPGSGGFGTGEYGVVPYGGGASHDPPTVVVTDPTNHSVNYGPGPTFTVAWTYAQAQSVPQAKYRVRIYRQFALTVVYDTGWLVGADSSIVIDAVAHGIPTDFNSYDLNVTVEVESADGPAFRGLSPLLDWFEIEWGHITPAITYPVDGASFNSSFGDQTVVWTGEPDDQGNHITFQRLRLLAADSAFVYADSGWVPWDWTIDPQQYDFVYPFVQGTHYKWELTLQNSNGVKSGPAFSSWWYLGEGQACVPLDTVGTLYEVAINGSGYMLFDGNSDVGADIRTELLRRTRVSSVLQAPRLATTQTPFNEAIERYTFFGGADFTGGTGQQNADRNSSDASAFLDSLNINPFDKHKITLLKQNGLQLADTFYGPNSAAISAVQAYGGGGPCAFALTAGSELSYSTDLASWTPVTITKDGMTTVTIEDLTSDGNLWYAACATDGILRGQTSDPAAVWSTVQAFLVRWAGQRICAAYQGPGSGTPNVFTTLTDSGLEEVPGGRITFPPGTTITDVTSGDGFVWISTTSDNGSGSGGAVYKWDMTAATPSVAWQLPVGQGPTAVFWYQGQVMIRVCRHSASSTEVLIYTATHQAGNLVPSLLADLGDDGYWNGWGTFGANDRFVFFGWNNSNGSAGLGAIDLSTGGYARWLTSSTGTSNISAIFEFKHRLCFMVGGSGLYAEHPTAYSSNGWLKTSIHDGASSVDKIIDRVMIRFDPLQNTDGIFLSVTYDGGNSYVSIPDFAQTPGQTVLTSEIGHRAQSVGLYIELDSSFGVSYTTTPAVNIWQVQVHPTSKADTILTLPIDCGDYVSDLNGRALPENGDGRGAIRARLLESLMASRVCVQDVDYFDTKIMEDFDVDDVKLIAIPAAIKEKQPGVLRLKQVALITLRKSLR